MKTIKEIEHLLQGCRITSDDATRQRLGSQLHQAWQHRPTQVYQHPRSRWQIRLTIAALILLVVSLALHLMDRVTPFTYALDQTVAAIEDIQYFHFQCRAQTGNIDREAWIHYDPNGQLRNVRVNFYQQDSVAVWNDGVTQYWLKNNNELAIFQDQHYTDKILFFAHRYDPKQAMGYLRGLEAKGDVHIAYHEQASTLDPISFSVFYEPNTFAPGQENPSMKEIYSIDPQTKCVSLVEAFTWSESNEDYAKGPSWEYIDYNQPVAPEQFELSREVPQNCDVLDTSHLELGLQQGTWTDEKAASKLIHRFLEAWENRHLEEAINYCAYLLPKHKQWFEATLAQYAITDIITIAPPQAAGAPQPGFTIDCSIACAHGGPAQTHQCRFHVRQYAPGQWMISPGFLFRVPEIPLPMEQHPAF